ncbi:MAG: shikimate kinase [Gemmatimonadota bacterium]|nr:shikimate kinase [Gemmatimonadota bacterium]
MIASGPLRILLVGFMGSGKSTVGAELARRLGWRFADADDVVERERGMTIPDIFARLGEPRFRELEHEVTQTLLTQERIVVASGGGWSAVPGRLGELSAATVSVWLRVSAEEAVRRARNQPRSRPLLGATDALGAVRELLRLRTPLYAEAEHEVDTESSSVEDVSIRVLELLGLNDPIADTE